MSEKTISAPEGERIAKVMARAGLCSRREAESWIEAGRVSVNGKPIKSPALNVTPADKIAVDNAALPGAERTRLFLYHKPRGVVTTHADPQGRPTIFDRMPGDLPRLLTVGRLDINTEGLLLLTNDGGLARVLELPATGWLRRYRVRAFGSVTPEALAALRPGITIDGIRYGPIEASLDRVQKDNVWITFAIREGKNREVRNVLRHLNLHVNRLIRMSFGPFQLGDLAEGDVEEVRTKLLREQLGGRIAQEAGANFDAPMTPRAQIKPKIVAEPEPTSRGKGPRGRDDRRDDKRGDRLVRAPVGKRGEKPGYRTDAKRDGARPRKPFGKSPARGKPELTTGERNPGRRAPSPGEKFRPASKPRPGRDARPGGKGGHPPRGRKR